MNRFKAKNRKLQFFSDYFLDTVMNLCWIFWRRSILGGKETLKKILDNFEWLNKYQSVESCCNVHWCGTLLFSMIIVWIIDTVWPTGVLIRRKEIIMGKMFHKVSENCNQWNIIQSEQSIKSKSAKQSYFGLLNELFATKEFLGNGLVKWFYIFSCWSLRMFIFVVDTSIWIHVIDWIVHVLFLDHRRSFALFQVRRYLLENEVSLLQH